MDAITTDPLFSRVLKFLRCRRRRVCPARTREVFFQCKIFPRFRTPVARHLPQPSAPPRQCRRIHLPRTPRLEKLPRRQPPRPAPRRMRHDTPLPRALPLRPVATHRCSRITHVPRPLWFQASVSGVSFAFGLENLSPLPTAPAPSQPHGGHTFTGLDSQKFMGDEIRGDVYVIQRGLASAG